VVRPVVLVTGFEPFGHHAVNPSETLALEVDGRSVGALRVRGAVLPVRRDEGPAEALRLLAAVEPAAVLHLGLAEGRARVALERVAVNVMDYPIPDNAGHRPAGEPIVPGGPAAYLSTLPLPDLRAALVAEGVPAYLSHSAGTYLCNQVLYTTLHAAAEGGLGTRVGFVHLPLLPAMAAAADADLPSMDLSTMRRSLDVALRVLAAAAGRGPRAASGPSA
jgi:pyroglutamyl-peptidase